MKNDGLVCLYRQEVVDQLTGKTSEKLGWNTDRKSKASVIDTLKKDKDGP